MYSPYDFQENMQHRDEMVRNSLRQGSPVVAVSYDEGIILLSVRRQQRKIFEIYDRLIFSAIGRQADVESVRLAAIDFAHQEGFQRSEDDVTIQRVVGFALSPALKKAYGDPMTLPIMIRAIFSEVGDKPEKDLVYALDYSGEFSLLPRSAGITGDPPSEESMNAYLKTELGDSPSFEKAVITGLTAWGIGREKSLRRDDEPVSDDQALTRLSDELQNGSVEIGLIERSTHRENRFRLVTQEQLEPYLKRIRR